jgi:hypothetical protein
VDPYYSVAMSRAAAGIANPHVNSYVNPYAAVAMRQSLLSEAVNPYAAAAMRQSLLSSEAGYGIYANPYATSPALAAAGVAATAVDGRLYASPTMVKSSRRCVVNMCVPRSRADCAEDEIIRRLFVETGSQSNHRAEK